MAVAVQVILVRQNQPGKRIAMGLALRAMSRYGVGPDDLAVFMDGDSILGERMLERCAPLFRLNAKLGAVTTDESAIVNGPGWMQSWHEMRFAQHVASSVLMMDAGRIVEEASPEQFFSAPREERRCCSR